MSKVDAAMVEQIARRLGLRMGLEICGGADNGRPRIRRHPHGHHVPFDELPEMNARVETRGNEVDAALIGGDVEQDVRIVAGKLSELWCEDGCRCKWRHQQAHTSGRPVTKRGKV